MAAPTVLPIPYDVKSPGLLRLAERLGAVTLLILFSPLLLTVLLLVRILSGQAPIVAHRRVGQYGRPFWMLKIRTMWDGRRSGCPMGYIEWLPDTHVPVIKRLTDDRVTSRFARFCRRYSIDELPQLVHVAAGLMSIIGPRPLTASELTTFYGNHAAEVLAVPPGLTGLWQVYGRNRLTYKQRLRLDLFLVRRRTPALYLIILLKTPIQVLSGRNSY